MILPDPDLRYWPDQPHHLTAFVGHISLLYQPSDLVLRREDRLVGNVLIACIYEATAESRPPALDLPGRRTVTSSSATGFADAALHCDPVVDQIVQSVQPPPIYVEPPPGAVRGDVARWRGHDCALLSDAAFSRSEL